MTATRTRRATLRDLERARPGDLCLSALSDPFRAGYVKEPDGTWTTLCTVPAVSPLRGYWISAALYNIGVEVEA